MAEQGAPEGYSGGGRDPDGRKGQKRTQMDSPKGKADLAQLPVTSGVCAGTCFHADPSCGHGCAEISERCNRPGVSDQMAE